MVPMRPSSGEDVPDDVHVIVHVVDGDEDEDDDDVHRRK
jgi:hypothetical protein